MLYFVIILLCFVANPVVFGMTVLVCAVYLLWRAKQDKKEWAARMAKRAEWRAEGEADNKIKASELWDTQSAAYSRDLPASLSGFEDKAFAMPKCFNLGGAKDDQ